MKTTVQIPESTQQLGGGCLATPPALAFYLKGMETGGVL